MILVDANLLIYAYNKAAKEHKRARRWVEAAFSGPVPVRLSWVVVLAFLRITTNPNVFRHPLSVAEATKIVDDWLAQPAVALLEPTERHWALLREQISKGQAIGPLTTDAHLAALAIEHGATVYTSDSDFSRFPDVTTVNPLTPPAAEDDTPTHQPNPRINRPRPQTEPPAETQRP
jgi:uncharacterized protein